MATELKTVEKLDPFENLSSKVCTNPVDYAAKHSLKVHPILWELANVTKNHPRYVMMCSLDELQLLQNLVRCIGAKKTLDIGVYTGVSTLGIALALPDDGKVFAFDIDEDVVNVGKPYWKKAGVDGKINFIKGPALEGLNALISNGESGTFDYAFIDADKENYINYYECCLKLVRSGGIIAVDNTLWSGDVYNPAINDPCTVIIRKLNEIIANDDRVYVSFLVIGDGTTLCFKK